MPRLFGTDGVRGVANRELTPDLALALGRAAGRVLAPHGGHIVVGRDTRVSGPMLEGALVAGLCSAGAQVLLTGVMTSPGIAWLASDTGARGAAVISASHNPVGDNGIKFFSAQGMKLAADTEGEIEALLAEPSEDDLAVGDSVGTVTRCDDAGERYISHLVGTISSSLKGLRIVLDCAFGAAWDVGPRAFRAAGADVVALHAIPDGMRINVDCGSTSLDKVAASVVAEGADFGLAFDGDADRVLAVDERGDPVDGDRILALLAVRLQSDNRLRGNVVVATVMSNMGFRRALEARGIEVVTAPVGDKFVVETMLERGAVLGGEQSGHIVFTDYAPTGDGVLTGLHIAESVLAGGAPLSRIARIYEAWPQVLLNVPVSSRESLDQATELWGEVASVEESLGASGRLLVRASGTEPVVRVMVEAADTTIAAAAAKRLASAVERHLGRSTH